MKTKHTQGEWNVSEYSNKHSTIITTLDTNICNVFKGGTEECKANAKLIAAAPELLEALIDAKKVLILLADKGQYPLELMQGEKENIGRNGFGFITNAINKATL